MCGFVYITPLHRVLVNLFNLLPHHILALNQLRVNALLPEFIGTITLMSFFIKGQLTQNLPDIVLRKILNQDFAVQDLNRVMF